MLERLVTRPPPRVRDRTLDAADLDAAGPAPSPRPGTVDVTCWTPVGDPAADAVGSEPRATLLAEPPLTDATDGAVAHTLVLEIDAPTRSVTVDYRSLDAAVLPDRGVRIRTDDGEAVAVADATIDDDALRVTLTDTLTDGALFAEYAVTRNPTGGRHTVGVTVDGDRETEARLVVIG
jgi:hypothetical protein